MTALRQTVLERAFDLAKSGLCASPSEIRGVLRREGYMDVTSQIAGPSLLKQLRTLCRQAARDKVSAERVDQHLRAAIQIASDP